MKWFYFYEVIFYDEVEDKKNVKDCGFIQARNYSEVMEQISDWYGEDVIDEIRIKPIEEGDGPLTLSHIKDTFKKEGVAIDE